MENRIGLNPDERSLLLELTSLPSVPGREAVAIAAVRRWAAARPRVVVDGDSFGNLLVRRAGPSVGELIVLQAHLDHPGFVVEAVDGRDVEASFRGEVEARFFENARVRRWSGVSALDGGSVTACQPGFGEGLARVRLRLDAGSSAAAGDVLTWDLPGAEVVGPHLLAPAVDDLAGVALALIAFDREQRQPDRNADLRLLLTRAEEIGFLGALAALEEETLPPGTPVLVLENARALPDAPVGGGPIIRVGDAAMSFDPQMTRRLVETARGLGEADSAFRWQRRLMDGGACEATAWQAHGHPAACLCNPMENYHNMDPQTGRIERERIDLRDAGGLLVLLGAFLRGLGSPIDPRRELRARLRSQCLQRRRELSLDEGPAGRAS
ncbi:hypothetical protein [Phycisphaera mikurensis]|uniref:Peptidase M42 family protein n=1 Tax=Phycisphaera mikurensis (strain NBRC 102666 / KCTC 22515 / FYK2301M01) TaxID=1142394 RepID=I0ICU4_PHYMF|nr:hypothetical protein [Phycisphaera mikurensis]MBB6443300.1 endoglucanase [Phycisphaera mikurensis]BAM03082.1 hypothetical protein PSMK_09230 [Phycisphaera mikurensis NBRC 102666]